MQWKFKICHLSMNQLTFDDLESYTSVEIDQHLCESVIESCVKGSIFASEL